MISVWLPKERPRILISFFFIKCQKIFSTVAAVADNPAEEAVSQISTHLNSCSNNNIKVNFNTLHGDNWFEYVASKMESEEIGPIINKLCVESAENAIKFFLLLQNELGVKHLRVSQFVIAHILARNQRPCALQSHLHQVLLEDGKFWLMES